MQRELDCFRILPSVVEADEETEITIKSVDGNLRFYDDVTYTIEFIQREESDIPIDKTMKLDCYRTHRKTYSVKPQNGELKIKFLFSGEQEWNIHISVQKYEEYEKYQTDVYAKMAPRWDELRLFPQSGIYLSVYSLYADLYTRRALKGDLHIHTSYSDGQESPELVAAMYKKKGYDFIAITDHYKFNTARYAKEKFDFKTSFRILHGEEVHNKYNGYFHMIHVGGSYSVNDIYQNEPQRVECEVTKIMDEITVPDYLDKYEYASRIWLYREIKKSGGFAIFSHPFWYVMERYHTETKMSRAIIKKEGLCDAFEILNGANTVECNSMQVALYHDMREQGINIPIVASTDSHSCLNGDNKSFGVYTIVYVQDDDILQGIADGYSVGIEAVSGKDVRVYGSLRLVKYTHFLIRNYFSVRKELSEIVGNLIKDYVHGEKSLKPFIENLDKRVDAFEADFFGRNVSKI